MISKIAVASVVKLFYEFAMQTLRNQKLIELFTFLEGILPASTIMVVAAGSSSFDPDTMCSNADAIHLCEPESGRVRKLKIRYNHLPQVTVHNCLIADEHGPTAYHQTSLASEDGLVDPQQLQSIWKNIRLEKRLELEARTVQSFFADATAELNPEASPDWLIIDCLRAPDILKGAGPLLDKIDVVVLKLTTVPDEKDDPLQSTGQAYLDTLGCLSGFKSVAIIQSSNSTVFHKFYVRDWKHKAKVELTEQIQRLEASMQVANSELEENMQALKCQATKNHDQLVKEKRLLENSLEDARQKFRELAKQRLSDEEQWKQVLVQLEGIIKPAVSDDESQSRDSLDEFSKLPEKTKLHSNNRGNNKQESGDK